MDTIPPLTREQAAAAVADDPLAFVMLAYPWGQPGTFLAEEEGPDTWQREVLDAWRAHMHGDDDAAFRYAVASGHGVGKTALVSWLIQYYMVCRVSPQIVVTANTGAQLRTKTWRELAKWHNISLFRDLYQWTATMYYHVGHEETWFAASIPWSERSIEAFQGTHERYVLLIFDEASAIPAAVYEAAEGSLTTPECAWFQFGNRTRSTGRFAQSFPPNRFGHRWHTQCVDSRTAKHANQQQIQEWIEDYGEESDFVRVRIRGLPPLAGTLQFIGHGLVAEAENRTCLPVATQPIILAVDVARFGLARSAIVCRQGNHVHEIEILRQNDTVRLARRTAEWANAYTPQAIFVDEVGIGAGVVDLLQSWGYMVIGVNGGAVAEEDDLYANKRAEMWGRLRQWLEHGGCLPPVPRTQWDDELCSVETGYDNKGRYLLERKDRVQAKVQDDPTFVSPDVGDALAMTFAERIAPVVDQRQRVTRQPAGVGFAPLYP